MGQLTLANANTFHSLWYGHSEELTQIKWINFFGYSTSNSFSSTFLINALMLSFFSVVMFWLLFSSFLRYQTQPIWSNHISLLLFTTINIPNWLKGVETITHTQMSRNQTVNKGQTFIFYFLKLACSDTFTEIFSSCLKSLNIYFRFLIYEMNFYLFF